MYEAPPARNTNETEGARDTGGGATAPPSARQRRDRDRHAGAGDVDDEPRRVDGRSRPRRTRARRPGCRQPRPIAALRRASEREGLTISGCRSGSSIRSSRASTASPANNRRLRAVTRTHAGPAGHAHCGWRYTSPTSQRFWRRRADRSRRRHRPARARRGKAHRPSCSGGRAAAPSSRSPRPAATDRTARRPRSHRTGSRRRRAARPTTSRACRRSAAAPITRKPQRSWFVRSRDSGPTKNVNISAVPRIIAPASPPNVISSCACADGPAERDQLHHAERAARARSTGLARSSIPTRRARPRVAPTISGANTPRVSGISVFHSVGSADEAAPPCRHRVTELVDHHAEERALQEVPGLPRVKRDREHERGRNRGRAKLPFEIGVALGSMAATSRSRS